VGGYSVFQVRIYRDLDQRVDSGGGKMWSNCGCERKAKLGIGGSHL
jgi:hypothetical protein